MKKEIVKLFYYRPSINPELFSEVEFEKINFLTKNLYSLADIVDELWWLLCEYKSHRNSLELNLNSSANDISKIKVYQENFQRYLGMMATEVAIKLNEYRVLIYKSNNELINSSSIISSVVTKRLRQPHIDNFNRKFSGIRELRNALCHQYELGSSLSNHNRHISVDALKKLGLSSDNGSATFIGCMLFPEKYSFRFYSTFGGNVVGLEFSEREVMSLLEITKNYYSIFYGLERDGMARHRKNLIDN